MDTRTFSSICIWWISSCVCLVSGEFVISVSGEEGSTAVLPCKLETVDTKTPYIEWQKESEIVFERQGMEFIQDEGYEGRVDVPERELRKGDCSLLLHNLTLIDSGVYKSYHRMRHIKRSLPTELKEISRVSLSVYRKTPEEKSDEVPSLMGDAGMTHPHPLIMISITTLILCFLIQLF